MPGEASYRRPDSEGEEMDLAFPNSAFSDAGRAGCITACMGPRLCTFCT